MVTLPVVGRRGGAPARSIDVPGRPALLLLVAVFLTLAVLVSLSTMLDGWV